MSSQRIPTPTARLLRQIDRRRLLRPAVVVVLAFALGAGLLGLAGWFIAESAVAGLAVASTFSFLFPSAGVQALAWSRTLARYGERIYTHEATLSLAGSLRTRLFARALQLPRERVAALRSSELLGRIMVDSDAVENLFLRTLFPAVGVLAALIGTAAFLATVSAVLTIAAELGLAVAGVLLIGLAHRSADRHATALVSARAEARLHLLETLDGLSELRSFGLEQRASSDVLVRLKRTGASRQTLTRVSARIHGAGVVLADLALLSVIVVAAGLTGAKALPAPTFVAVCLVVIAACEPILAIPGAVTARARARASAARLADLFPDGDRPAVARPEPDGSLTTLELTLAESGRNVIAGPGDTVLLTGVSGSGKSTLLGAIAGATVPGIEVRLGGWDVTELNEQTLVNRVTLVAQDAHVFDGTIRENLQLADPRAPEFSLWDALGAAALANTVAAFPAGLDTPVGPGGESLSGGQRRRLSVAQGLLRQTAVLLLDEPTEGLDADSAVQLLAGARAYRPDAAVVIALHDRQFAGLPWEPTERIPLGASLGPKSE